jgi:hypothetical protein
MLRLLQAGLVVAGRQLVAVLVITLLASLLTSHNFAVQEASSMSSGTESSRIFLSQLLIWAYLLFAVGFALTGDRSIDLTAKRIRHASRLMRFVPPGHASRTLVAQFGIAAVVFAVFALRTPPDSLIEGSRYFGCAGVASIAWAGIMSIGVACFGASAHAALKSI